MIEFLGLIGYDDYGLITEACRFKVIEISDLACVIQELKKYIARVLKLMR